RTSLYDGESTIPQLHNDHNDIDRQARFCYRWEEGFGSTSGRGVPLFDDLRALVEFARAGSIAGAADRLYRTPSAVTRQLQRLEDALGAELRDRCDKPPCL